MLISNTCGIVRQWVNTHELKRRNYRRISRKAVKANISLPVRDVGKEIGVGTSASNGFRPGGAPAEDDGALDGDVEGRGVGLAVVVVVDNESAEEVTTGGEGGDNVAVLLAVRDWEEAKGLLVGVVESEWLGDDGVDAAGEEAVGEPRGVEGVGGIGGAAAVNVVR